MDLPAASGVADELFWSSRDGDDLGGIKSAYPEWRAGSSLAVDAVTGDNQLGWHWKRERNSAATASSVSHRKISQLRPGQQSSSLRLLAMTEIMRPVGDLHPARIVRRFARDGDVVHMALAQAGAGDAHELCLLLELGDVLCADIAHRGA